MESNPITPAQIVLIPFSIWITYLLIREAIRAFKPYSDLDPEFDIKAEQKEFKNIKW